MVEHTSCFDESRCESSICHLQLKRGGGRVASDDWLAPMCKTSSRNFKELHDGFWKIDRPHHRHQRCLFEEHHAVAVQARTLEGAEAEAVEVLELVEVSVSKPTLQSITDGLDRTRRVPAKRQWTSSRRFG